MRKDPVSHNPSSERLEELDMVHLRHDRRFFFAMIVVAAIGFANGTDAQTSNEAIWQQFTDWLASAPQFDGPREMYNKYRAEVVAKGASINEADRQMDIIERLMRERPDAYRAMFNNIYRTDNPVFSTQPNALLVEFIEQRKPGRALDIGIGQGRNSVFLALKGWDVTGFDASDEGIATAQRNATRAGAKINAIRETEAAFDYGADQWDLIVFTYEPFPITSAAYVERLGTALKPGGIIVVESLSQEDQTPNRTPVSIDPARLLTAFNTQQFRILRFEDTMGKSDWNAGQKRLVRMVAEKRQ
jgi:2-polyprenyl-3-methyl-5-hydroxy-6-metoxy-1,4-benzoquinol methylase